MTAKVKKDFNFLVMGSYEYYEPFLRVGRVVSTEQYDLADCIVFTGGADIDPRMYGEEKHRQCYATDPNRDSSEEEVFNYAVRHGIPMVGICRGAQFLNVMNGGKLIQHSTGHTMGHQVELAKYCKYKQKTFEVTSTHHQLMVPDVKKGHELIAFSRNVAKIMAGVPLKEYTAYSEKHSDGMMMAKEAEVLWYDVTNSLCVQYHPERMAIGSDGALFFEHLLEEYILP